MASIKPILVTGSHRSGTTWVGKMIASSPAVGYIQEPFHPCRRPGICAVTFPYPFAYVTDENGTAFYDHMKATLSFQFQFGAALATLKTPRDVAIMLKYGTEFFFSRSRRVVPLIKDPLAVFSAEWLARRFEMNVIVMIRHPAAFACSIRRRNWRHNFSHFLQQPLLMQDHLFPFEGRNYGLRELRTGHPQSGGFIMEAHLFDGSQIQTSPSRVDIPAPRRCSK